MDKNSKIIAIDGPAASGKGTLARSLALALGFSYMDTGALYRAVAFETLEAGFNPAQDVQAVKGCEILGKKLKKIARISDILENHILRSDEIAQAASQVATFPGVRNRLIEIQRNFAIYPPKGTMGAVLDGRDIGTVICPDAGLKLYVTADLEIRAQRRMKELHSKGIRATYEAVLEDMRARDARDSSRKAAPLKPAEDAIVIDSSNLSEGEMLEIARNHATKAYGLTSAKPA